jgi:hypothetical protein
MVNWVGRDDRSNTSGLCGHARHSLVGRTCICGRLNPQSDRNFSVGQTTNIKTFPPAAFLPHAAADSGTQSLQDYPRSFRSCRSLHDQRPTNPFFLPFDTAIVIILNSHQQHVEYNFFHPRLLPLEEGCRRFECTARYESEGYGTSIHSWNNERNFFYYSLDSIGFAVRYPRKYTTRVFIVGIQCVGE